VHDDDDDDFYLVGIINHQVSQQQQQLFKNTVAKLGIFFFRCSVLYFNILLLSFFCNYNN